MIEVDKQILAGNGNKFIKEQNEFDWKQVKFPAIVKSINNDVMRIAYVYKIDSDGLKQLYGGYHCSFEKDTIGLSSNFILTKEGLE